MIVVYSSKLYSEKITAVFLRCCKGGTIMKIMHTSNNPNHCPECESDRISLENKVYYKGKINLGIWQCLECGYIMGRKISIYDDNEIDERSI